MIPDEIGKSSNEEDHLLNGYYRTEAGLYVPSMVSFFGDSYARALLGVWPLIRNISKYGTADEDMTEFTSQDSHDEVVKLMLNTIDEVLVIVDPEASFSSKVIDSTGQSLRGKGVYHPDATEFFNRTVLHVLYEHSKGPFYDYEEEMFTVKFDELKQFWEQLQECYFKFTERWYDPVEKEAVSPGLKKLLEE
jgi:hypothetical protein